MHGRRRQAPSVGDLDKHLHGFQAIHDCLESCIRRFRLYRISMHFPYMRYGKGCDSRTDRLMRATGRGRAAGRPAPRPRPVRAGCTPGGTPVRPTATAAASAGIQLAMHAVHLARQRLAFETDQALQAQQALPIPLLDQRDARQEGRATNGCIQCQAEAGHHAMPARHRLRKRPQPVRQLRPPRRGIRPARQRLDQWRVLALHAAPCTRIDGLDLPLQGLQRGILCQVGLAEHDGVRQGQLTGCLGLVGQLPAPCCASTTTMAPR